MAMARPGRMRAKITRSCVPDAAQHERVHGPFHGLSGVARSSAPLIRDRYKLGPGFVGAGLKPAPANWPQPTLSAAKCGRAVTGCASAIPALRVGRGDERLHAAEHLRIDDIGAAMAIGGRGEGRGEIVAEKRDVGGVGAVGHWGAYVAGT
jgi:hypothetical protein